MTCNLILRWPKIGQTFLREICVNLILLLLSYKTEKSSIKSFIVKKLELKMLVAATDFFKKTTFKFRSIYLALFINFSNQVSEPEVQKMLCLCHDYILRI